MEKAIVDLGRFHRLEKDFPKGCTRPGQQMWEFMAELPWPRLYRDRDTSIEREQVVLKRDPSEVFAPMATVGLRKADDVIRLIGSERGLKFSGFVLRNLGCRLVPAGKIGEALIWSRGGVLLRIPGLDPKTKKGTPVYATGPDSFEIGRSLRISGTRVRIGQVMYVQPDRKNIVAVQFEGSWVREERKSSRKDKRRVTSAGA